ncbi:3'-5' exoribonuclease YhaM family protein [Emergencia sp. 1XD21-10]|uniref:3'-5' exoribonuclease YhaM family protein n=1 Tax=Emergencia sp. 1XD21-10 TaxID=2304569 RepID=UPI00137B7631|nr:HD domain-containing protein [Emergencia sp. 1XD21-10]MCI9640536.1 HD domain-containing protein [Emergencia sp.]NCE99609.1 HD domain-containing protein [Emergencia sp. 1XD21-10]
MKQFYAADLKGQSEITDFFMVKSANIKVGANKKQYFDVVLGDKSGEVNGKKWEILDDELELLSGMKEGDLIKVRAQVTEWQGQSQLRISRIRAANSEDALEISEYVKAAPEDSEEMYSYIYSVAESMEDKDLRALCTKVLSENKERLLYYPAASKNHHAEYGGLLYHIKRMLMTGLRVCEVYTNLNRDLVATGVILHDIEKLNEILSNEYGVSPGYSFEGQMLGHIVQGVKFLDRTCRDLGFSEEKTLMLEHMILAHHYEPEFGSPKKPLFPEAEVLHYLDILDARMFDMEDALRGVAPGEFSDRIWTLDNRRIYKPTEDGGTQK